MHKRTRHLRDTRVVPGEQQRHSEEGVKDGDDLAEELNRGLVELDTGLKEKFATKPNKLAISHQGLHVPELSTGQNVPDGSLRPQNRAHALKLAVPPGAHILVESPGTLSLPPRLDL